MSELSALEAWERHWLAAWPGSSTTFRSRVLEGGETWRHWRGKSARGRHPSAKRSTVVILAIPTKVVPDLPATLFANSPSTGVVVDIGTYHPELRDGRIDAVDRGELDSQWVAQQNRPSLNSGAGQSHHRGLELDIDDAHRLALRLRRGLPSVGGELEEGHWHNLRMFPGRAIAFDDTLAPDVSRRVQKVHNELKAPSPSLCVVGLALVARHQAEFEKDVCARCQYLTSEVPKNGTAPVASLEVPGDDIFLGSSVRAEKSDHPRVEVEKDGAFTGGTLTRERRLPGADWSNHEI